MNELKEFSIALVRIVLGIVVLVGGLIALDVMVFISATGSTSNEKVAAAYGSSYDQGYTGAYGVGYREAHGEAYEKGYEKGYEIARRNGSEEGAATRVELYNPTYREMKEFLVQDKTNENPFIKGQYVCFDFAAELNNNAEASGIRAAYVRIRTREWGHAVVVFETVDRGLIFIEPQSDKEVLVVEGQPYPWQSVGASRPSNYDDAIEELQIIW